MADVPQDPRTPSRAGWRARLRFAPAALAALNGRRALLTGRLSFGIASWLGAAFVGVAALVLVANAIVEHGTLIERTTETTRFVPTPPIVHAPASTAAPVVAEPPPEKPPAKPAERRAVTSDALMAALDRFGRAVRERVNAKTEDGEAEYRQSLAALDGAAEAFVTQAVALRGKSYSKLRPDIAAYEQHADALLQLADSRRATMSDYLELFERISGRVNTSLNGAWKLFGRVIARQPLVQLDADLNALRRASSALATAAEEQAPEMQGLLRTEQAITNNLSTNERSFRRAESDAWFAALHEDCARLLSLRQSLLPLNAETGRRSHELSDEAARLALAIPARVEAPVDAVAAKARRNADSHASRQAPARAPPAAAPAAAPIAAVVQTRSVAARAQPDPGNRTVMVWLSLGLFLLLLCIALGIVMGIVGSVRRLRDATLRVARGEAAVPVRRGGIRELDSLADAFNAMAGELATAKAATRQYQQGLEAKVLERTQQLRELAQRDPLTGLPNRRELFVLLNAAIERARGERCLVGVYFLDLDNFKYLNDTMGHAFGDRVLMSFARRLQEVTRNIGFAARLGGDEFTVVFERAGSVEDIRLAGLRVVQAFQKPLSVDGRDLVISISVGASIHPDHEQDAEALLKAADAALFRAKALGRSQLAVFTPELLAAAAAKFTTEQRLRHAIERGEFELVFQPEVSAETLQASLVEALVRWRMPDGTLATPEHFLAIAEESGLIVDISDWVLASAIEAAANWHHGAWPDARVAINVSPRQLLDHRFVDRLQDLLDAHRLPARCIEIELTESVLQTGAATIDALRRLRARGIAIALDDFGTGYSSLVSLQHLPLTRIKLDRGLIAGIDTNERSAAIAHAIIGMCHGLGLEVTAEGVERPEQFALLLRYPRLHLQGFLLSRPVARDRVVLGMSETTQRAQELLLTTQAAGSTGRAEAQADSLPILSQAG
jgi:diguanylate cyclase (GGDEF)-like protein